MNSPQHSALIQWCDRSSALNQPPQTHSRRIISIQVCRGLAALLVVAVHLHGIETKFCNTNHTLLLEHGALGVDLFFVISGVVISSVTIGKFGQPREAARFLYHRLARIFPILWIYTTLALIAYRFQPAGTADFLHPITILSSYLLLPSNQRLILLQAWTLTSELYFYLIFFLLLLFIPERLSRWFIALWGITIILLKLHVGLSPSAVVQTLLTPMTLEFLAGCVIFHIYRRRRLHKTAGILLILAALLWLTATLAYSLHAHPGRPTWIIAGPWLRPLLYGSFAALFLLGAIELERSNLIRFFPILKSIGDWSYSIYLSHILVLELIARILSPLHPNIFVIALISLPFVLAAGYLSYTFIERPILNRLYKSAPA
jgi:exopolysaccharide production protein ExoZ